MSRSNPDKSGQDVQDPSLLALYREPYRLHRPFRQTSPFIFASPHSGCVYPPSFVARSKLSPLALRRSEDAFVDELFCGAVALGAPLIAARFPRAFVDANRAPDELDSHMFDGELGIAADAPSSRVAAGLGVIPRIVRDGAEIYRGKLMADEAEERLANLYRPYHAALSDLVAETRERFGTAIVIDCHSMPSASAAPDIVLGDRYGAAAAPLLTRQADIAFQRNGFSVARNAPYAGGYTTLLHGRRERDTHALQIEINRALYLDEEHVQRGPRFEEVHAAITDALAYLATIDVTQLRRAGPVTRFAAE